MSSILLQMKPTLTFTCTTRKEYLCKRFGCYFLLVLKDNITEEDFKYKTLEEFLASYPGAFDTLDEKEKNNLWHTANWMVLLFQMIPARKNKGLAIHVGHL